MPEKIYLKITLDPDLSIPEIMGLEIRIKELNLPGVQSVEVVQETVEWTADDAAWNGEGVA